MNVLKICLEEQLLIKYYVIKCISYLEPTIGMRNTQEIARKF